MNHFLERYTQLGETFDPELIIIRRALRVNTLKISEEKLIPRLKRAGVTLEKIPFLQNAYYFEASFALSSMTEYLLGFFYLQEAACQLPAEVLLSDCTNFSSLKILDMAAAPGSKTTQLAQLTQDKALIVAIDNNAPRLDTLRHNLERMGVSSVIVYKKDGRYVSDVGERFDYILLDAPCSGNFCVNENFFSTRSIILDVKERSRLQKDLLKAAYRVLNKGGTLVYSTCSLEPEEDELLINWFIKEYSDMYVVDTNLTIGDAGVVSVFDQELNKDISKTRRFWPHKTGTEGFFIAKLKKR